MNTTQLKTVVLVDERGHDLLDECGKVSVMEIAEAHRRGLLHSAVSVFVFNDANELLLQKRAAGKYHSAEKWTNTCCTHPRPGEAPVVTAHRRLNDEMGLSAPLTEIFTFSYTADVGNGLIENEFDHVFLGTSNRSPVPDPAEVSDWSWTSIEEIEQGLARNPENYSPWLRECFKQVVKWIS